VRQDNVVTSAGVSAGLDLALWLAGQIGGEGRAKAIQLAIEYDPQPPFDSGHMSKASAATKAAATALLSKDSAKPANLKATTLLAWEQALAAVRSRRRRRVTPATSVPSSKA
jgi:transcriptional regulator GlxA family with amidase domain